MGFVSVIVCHSVILFDFVNATITNLKIIFVKELVSLVDFS